MIEEKGQKFTQTGPADLSKEHSQEKNGDEVENLRDNGAGQGDEDGQRTKSGMAEDNGPVMRT
jgi:hypothetical protein